jgi:hypothetical protein
VDEVRNVAPAGAIDRVDLDAIGEELALLAHPEIAELVVVDAVAATSLVDGDLEAGERVLTKHRAVHLVERLDEETAARGRVVRAREQMIGDQHLGEDRRGLGENQGRLVVEEVLPARERVVHGVPELVSEGCDVAAGLGVG